MIQVVNKAIDILEFVAQTPDRPKLLGEIAANLNLNNATCANIVKTLVNRGYIEKMRTQKGYIPGKQLYRVAGSSLYNRDIIDAAAPYMYEATEQLQENTLLAVLGQDIRSVIYRCNSSQLIQANTPDEKKAYDSSTGRLLIAMMPDDVLEKHIARYGLPSSAIWPTAGNKKKFMDHVSAIRKNGYCLIEDSVQIVGIATPVYKQENIAAAFSIYMPSFRFNNKLRKAMIETSIKCAKKITDKLKG